MLQSQTFKTLEYARVWAYNQKWEDIMFLIHDKENNQYSFVNESKLFYLQNCWVLDLEIVEVWE